jgi:hypothetical protein
MGALDMSRIMFLDHFLDEWVPFHSRNGNCALRL